MFKISVFTKGEPRGWLDLKTQEEVDAKIQEWTDSEHWGRNARFVFEDDPALDGLNLQELQTEEVQIPMTLEEILDLTEEEKEDFIINLEEYEQYLEIKSQEELGEGEESELIPLAPLYEYKKTILKYLAPAEWSYTVEDITSKYEQEQTNEAARKFLNETDWLVLRHVGQLALDIPTSLTPEEYLELEEERQEAREKVED